MGCRIWRRNATDTSRRSVARRHIFFRYFSRLSRRKAYTDIVESTTVACEAGITKGTTVKRRSGVNFPLGDTVEVAGEAGMRSGLAGAEWRISGREASESSEWSIFA